MNYYLIIHLKKWYLITLFNEFINDSVYLLTFCNRQRHVFTELCIVSVINSYSFELINRFKYLTEIYECHIQCNKQKRGSLEMFKVKGSLRKSDYWSVTGHMLSAGPVHYGLN